MDTRNLFPITALTVILGAAVTPASAQTVVVTEATGTSGALFTYTYTVTPSFNAQLESFLFTDSNVSTSIGGLKSSSFTFTDTIPAGTPDTFEFFSSDPAAPLQAATSELGFQFLRSGISVVQAGQSDLIGPLAAPEPGSLTSLAVLGGCLALGITARRRMSRN